MTPQAREFLYLFFVSTVMTIQPLGGVKRQKPSLAPMPSRSPITYFGLRFAKIRCKVRRCMFKRRAVSLTFRSHSSYTR